MLNVDGPVILEQKTLSHSFAFNKTYSVSNPTAPQNITRYIRFLLFLERSGKLCNYEQIIYLPPMYSFVQVYIQARAIM